MSILHECSQVGSCTIYLWFTVAIEFVTRFKAGTIERESNAATFLSLQALT